jgi:hypothetical protein
MRTASLPQDLGSAAATEGRNLNAPLTRESGVRPRDLSALRAHLGSLQDHRSRLLAEVSVLDDMIADVFALCTAIESNKLAPAARAELAEQEHLAPFGDYGVLVTRIAAKRGVPLHHILGPGRPATVRARAARCDAAIALAQAGVGCTTAGRILRISEELARRLQHERKTAA